MGLFSKKKNVDVSLLHTDIHSHMIPGIDDGSASMKESVSLIKQMSEIGYKKMILTPHVRYGSFDNDTYTFDSRLEELKQVLDENGVQMDLEVGAEQTIDDGFYEHFERGELKSFGKNNYVLIELSFINLPVNLKQLVFELESKGYNLILAHPERYLYLKNELDLIDDLIDSGVLFQMNALSLVDFYGKPVRKFAEFLIKNDCIDLVGTDLHHQKHMDALKKALTNEKLSNLVESGRLLNNRF